METDQPCFSANRIDVFGKCDEYPCRLFYQEHGVQQIAGAYEKERVEDAVLMFCKHCLRYSMGWCPIHQRVRSPYREPYFLVSNDGKRFRLEFDCKNCQMKVKAAQ